MKNNIKSILPEETVISKIYLIRGMKVMLDSDLAMLYGTETRILNQAVLRNIERFPSDFMITLTPEEWENLKSQIVTSSWGGKRKLPSAFTEHGVLMLSSVLKTDRAIQVNIEIMRVFNRIRQKISENAAIWKSLEELERKSKNHTKNIELIFEYIEELSSKNETLTKKGRRKIGYNTNVIYKLIQ